jgi:pilus assembly protein CpaB
MFLRRFLLVLGSFALLAGLGLTGIWILEEASVPPTDVQIAEETILVAARPIPAGSLLRAEDIYWKAVPATKVMPDNLRRGQIAEADFVGAVTRRGLTTDEPLAATAIIKPTESGFLSAVMAAGMRAVSINVAAAEAIAGLIAPGDHVDVILTQTFGDDTVREARSVSETVLEDLRVIAVGQDISSASPAPQQDGATRGPEQRLPKTITLEVAAQQAEALMVAVQLGRIQLALLSLDRTTGATIDQSAAPPVWAGDVSSALRGPAASSVTVVDKAVSRRVEPNAVIEIEIMRGMQVDRQCFSERETTACAATQPAAAQ